MENEKPTKRKARPLLVAGAGLALVVLGGGACGTTAGNLLAPQCPDAGVAVCGNPDAGTDGGH